MLCRLKGDPLPTGFQFSREWYHAWVIQQNLHNKKNDSVLRPNIKEKARYDRSPR